MSLERVILVPEASVPTPPTGKVYRFIDTDGLLKIKDDTGTVSVVSKQFSFYEITNDYLAKVPASTIKGNNTGSTDDVKDLTSSQVTAMLNTFTGTDKGLVPASGGGTTNFLRADGSFSNPLPLVYDASSTTTFTNSSTTDTLITGMSITPAAGTYIGFFNTYTDSTTSNRLHYFSFYIGGVKITSSERIIFSNPGAYETVTVIVSKFTVTGIETVEIRHRMGSGTGNVYSKIMTLIRCQ